jgi:hypothetical protein
MRHAIGGKPARIIPRTEIKIKCVCKPCNQGWMHDLETLNIPIVGCLMEDVSMPLSSEQQSTVARWAVKTSMVQDAIHTRKRALFYTTLERAALRVDATIPPHTLVWLGRSSLRTLSIDGTDIGLDFHDTMTKIPEAANGYVSTIVVGHLALQIVTIHVPGKYYGRPFDIPCQVLGPWIDLLVPIWPVNATVNWPPRFFFRGMKGITKLADRLRGGIRL